MNKAYKYTLTANEHKEITFDVGVNRLAISNANGMDGDITIVTSEITKTDSGEICSFVGGADAPFADFKANIKAIQSGSGDPSPDNVRPISGWTGANIYDNNKNFVNIADSTISSAGYVLNNVAINVPKGSFVLSFDFSGTIGASASIRFDDENGNAIFTTSKTIASGKNAVNVTLDTKASYIKIYSQSIGTYSNFQIEIGGQATDYVAQSQTINNIDWQSTAGTVYGGTLDVKADVLTVTHANIASYNGETINEPWISSMDKYVAGATPTTGAQVVYPLTTPVTYQLTPTEVRSLLGVNNVWADCGPVDVRYFVQSTQPMIDYIDEKMIVYFDAQEDFSTYDISLVGTTSTDIKNCLLANKNANIVIRVKRYSTILLYYLREYSPNYFAEFASHAVIFDAEGTKSMRINYLRLDLTQETSDFTDDYIILPTS